MKHTAVFALFIFLTICESKEKNVEIENEVLSDPDMHRNVSTLISSKGYPVENYKVQTVDGYILSLQRIPWGRKCRFKKRKKPVVFLQHGFLDSACSWVINFPYQSLGFILADAGYDVWMGNTRGNTYSRQHVKYKPDENEFWNFSIDEMGQYDLPAMIDYVLNFTGEKKLYYIGHSQGTTQAFVLLSEVPEYNEKVKLFIAMAPVAYLGHMTYPIRYLTPFSNVIGSFLKMMGTLEFLPKNGILKVINDLVCKNEKNFLCENLFFVLHGKNKNQLNETRIGVYSSHFPEGCSVKTAIHYAQLVQSKLFAKFDYGEARNIEEYKQTTPPKYNISRITAPVALFWSKDDPVAHPEDVKILQRYIKSLASSYCVPFPEFNHSDFLLAVDAYKLLYNYVLSLLGHY